MSATMSDADCTTVRKCFIKMFCKTFKVKEVHRLDVQPMKLRLLFNFDKIFKGIKTVDDFRGAIREDVEKARSALSYQFQVEHLSPLRFFVSA